MQKTRIITFRFALWLFGYNNLSVAYQLCERSNSLHFLTAISSGICGRGQGRNLSELSKNHCPK
jgi:hypothetical protein